MCPAHAERAARTVRACLLASALAWLTAWLAACGGSTSGVEAPAPPARSELTGTVTPGYVEQVDTTAGPVPRGSVTVSVRGSAGIMRTSDSFGAGPAQQHRTGLAELSPPYMLSSPLIDGSFLTSVATGSGQANVTSLTTLLTAQLLGADPHTSFLGYGAESTVLISRITDTQIAEAQAKVTAYLEGTLGVTVRSGTASFITSPFAAVAGDPMYDTLVALHEHLVAAGSTLTALSQTLADEARLCLTEKISITSNGQASDFCPKTKAGEPETDDASVLRHVFTNSRGDTLTVRLRGDTVLSVSLQDTAGAADTCQAAACRGVTLGTPASDLSRTIAFSQTALGGVALNGNLTLPVPGVSIPVLPCDNNHYALVLPDRSVAAACVDTDDPIGVGGVLGGAAGLPRIGFSLGGALQVYAVDGQVTRITFLQPYQAADGSGPFFFECQAEGCAGAVFGPATVNTDLGVDLTLRDLTLTGVSLKALNPDGSAATGVAPATLQGVFTTITYIDPTELSPPPNDCVGTTDRFIAQPDYRPEAVAICPLPGDKRTVPEEDGGLSISVIGSVPLGSSPLLYLSAREGEILQIRLFASGDFTCSPCTQVTLGPPNALGERVVTFKGTRLEEVGPAGLPGDHAMTLTGSFIAPAPDAP